MARQWASAVLAASVVFTSISDARPASYFYEPAEADATIRIPTTVYRTQFDTVLAAEMSRVASEVDTTVRVPTTVYTTQYDTVLVAEMSRQASLHGAGSPHRPADSHPTAFPTLTIATHPSGFFPTAASGHRSGFVMPTASGSAYPTTNLNSSSNATSDALPDKLRGVNVGGWLILEKWMNSDMFDGNDASDQLTFDQTDGAQEALEKHWSTYFTESDVEKIASWGINALRIPIGYWAYDTFGAHYIQGADAYLEKAIGWARTHGLKVLVDCHGSPGSQNGFDNSGQSGAVMWQAENNLQDSIAVLETMAEKYGSQSYADVVFALELVNEPISWDQNNFTKTQEWAKDAYNAVKSKATNKDLRVIMHDGFMGPSEWQEIGQQVNGNATRSDAHFGMDVHLYQNQDSEWNSMDQTEHIAAACNWTNSKLLPSSATLPVYVGEWASGTNVCVNPDGTSTAGTTCTVSGCQCGVNVALADYSPALTKATRQFVEAQMDAFEHSSNGWFIWSYHGPGGWGLDNMVQAGLIGTPVTERKYPNQCGFA